MSTHEPPAERPPKIEARLIFLDFDGVLNSERSHIALGASVAPTIPDDDGPDELDEHGRPRRPRLDPVAVGLLRKAVEKTGAKIYVHSSWANRRSADYFRRLFAFHYAWPDAPILERCPEYRYRRHERIEVALDHYRPSAYAILDDEDLSGHFEGRTVRTTWADGLTLQDYHSVLSLFGVKPPVILI